MCVQFVSHVQLFLATWTAGGSPGSSVHGMLQARILEWVAISSSRGSSLPRDQTHVSLSPALAGGFFTTIATWEAWMLAGGQRKPLL